MPIDVDRSLVIPDAELEWRFSRSGGPGGQHANKASTRVELTWNAGDSAVLTRSQRRRIVEALGAVVRVVVDEERSQIRNREIAASRLADRVRSALVVTRPRRSTRPTAGSRRRRVEQKRRRSETKRLRQRPRADD